MKLQYLFAFILLIFVGISCSDNGDSAAIQDVPECVSDLLDIFIDEQGKCEGANLSLYAYQDIDVYTFKDGTCISDGGIRVIDEGCGDICFLGGIAGFTECNEESWDEGAVLQRVIWKSDI